MKEIFSPLMLAEKLLRNAATAVPELQEGLEIVGKHIEKKAKEEIGHYQSAIGPFPSWAPLADSTLEDKEKKGYSPPDNPLLRTGDLRDSISHHVEALSVIVGSTSQVMVYQEFGTSKMPMRPVIGPAAFRSKKTIKRIIGAAVVKGFFSGGLRIHKNLGYNFETGDE